MSLEQIEKSLIDLANLFMLIHIDLVSTIHTFQFENTNYTFIDIKIFLNSDSICTNFDYKILKWTGRFVSSTTPSRLINQ